MKRIIIIILYIISYVLSLESCGREERKLITDRAGYEVLVPAQIEKIISTAPATTEIIAALGLGDKIIATDRYSKDLPGISSNLQELDFLYPDTETIINLNPDIIVANGINKHGTGGDPFLIIKENGIPVVYVPMSNSIEDIYKDIQFIAGMLRKSSEGEAIVNSMKNQIAEISETGKTIKNKKKVYFEIAPPPQIVALGGGTYMNEMIELIGAVNIFGKERGILFPSEESIIMRNPDVILTNIYYLIDDPVAELRVRPGFESVTAVKNNDIYLIDANSSSRPTQNIIKALKEMALDVYPEYYARTEAK